MYREQFREINTKVTPNQMEKPALQPKRKTLYYKTKWTDLHTNTHTHTHIYTHTAGVDRPTAIQFRS